MADDDPLRESADLEFAGLDRSELKVEMQEHPNLITPSGMHRDIFPLVGKPQGWRAARFTHADGLVCQEPNECEAGHKVMVFR